MTDKTKLCCPNCGSLLVQYRGIWEDALHASSNAEEEQFDDYLMGYQCLDCGAWLVEGNGVGQDAKPVRYSYLNDNDAYVHSGTLDQRVLLPRPGSLDESHLVCPKCASYEIAIAPHVMNLPTGDPASNPEWRTVERKCVDCGTVFTPTGWPKAWTTDQNQQHEPQNEPQHEIQTHPPRYHIDTPPHLRPDQTLHGKRVIRIDQQTVETVSLDELRQKPVGTRALELLWASEPMNAYVTIPPNEFCWVSVQEDGEVIGDDGEIR